MDADEVTVAVQQDLQQIQASYPASPCKQLDLLAQLVLSYADELDTLGSQTQSELLQGLLDAALASIEQRGSSSPAAQPGHSLPDTWQSFLDALRALRTCASDSTAAAVRQRACAFWKHTSQLLLAQDSLSVSEHMTQLVSLGSFLPALLDSLLDASSAHGVHFLESATHATVTRMLAFLAIRLPQLRSPALCLLWELIAAVDEGDAARHAYLAPHFANVVGMLQVPAFTSPAAEEDGSTEQCQSHQSSASSMATQAYQFLRSLKLTLYPDPVWDGCFAGVVNRLAVLALEKGVKALQKGHIRHLCALVAQPEEAQGMLHTLLALPVLCNAKKGERLALDVYLQLYEGQATCILAGCAECLKPEADHPYATRLAALNAMECMANAYLDAHEDDDMALPALWPAEALDMVIFTLAHDGSLRVRRSAMSLLTTVVVEKQSAQERALLQAVLLRCRDVDALIRQQAFAMLAQFTSASLLAVLQPQDWVSLLDMAFADGAQAGSDEQPAAEHAARSPVVGQAGKAGTAQRSRAAQADAQAATRASGLVLFTKLLTACGGQAESTNEPGQRLGARPKTQACPGLPPLTSAMYACKSLGLASASDGVHEMYSKALAKAMQSEPALGEVILSQLVEGH